MGFFETLSILNLNEANSGSVLTTVSGDKFKKNNKGVWDKEIAVVDVSTKLDKPTTEKTELEATDKIVLLDSLGNSKYVLGSKFGVFNDLDPFGDGSQKAYYKLDNSVLDSMGSYNGTNNNVTFETRKSGLDCAEFNGSNSNISLSFTPPTVFSVCFWVYVTKTSGDNIIFSSNTSSSLNYISLACCGHGLTCRLNSSISFQSSNLTQKTNEWVFYVIVDTGSKIKAYQNGTEYTNSSTTYNHIGFVFNKIGYYADTAHSFGGKSDNIRFFNRELTQTEVITIYSKDL